MSKPEQSGRGFGVIVVSAVYPTLCSVIPTQIPMARILNVCICKHPDIVTEQNIALCSKCKGVC